MSQVTESSASHYYDQNYFDWQKNIGAFGGWANSYKFLNTVRPDDVVLDFGCGGGFLLARLSCRERIGIEPNIAAREIIEGQGILHFSSLSEALEKLGESSVDVIISNHALEHTINPLEELKLLKKLLKQNGKIHFFVPCDSIYYSYDPEDVNYHLYSWSPQNIGNLFHEAGFEIIYCRPYIHKWPPFYRFFGKLGWPIFDFICRIYARIDRLWRQVEIKAEKL